MENKKDFNSWIAIIIILCCTLTALPQQNIVAQTVVATKYNSGQPKTRHRFQNNQLICIENLLENGNFYNIIWADSVYEYGFNQNIKHKLYCNHKPSQWIKPILGRHLPHSFEYREAKQYYPDGQLWQHYWWQEDTLLTYNTYSQNNKHYEQVKYKKLTQHRFQQIVQRKDYRQEYIVDTLTKTTQYVLYIEERLRMESFHQMEQNNASKLLKKTLWDATGQLLPSMPPDSLKVKPDKNAELCLYGFRNHRDEWVIPPKYENIMRFVNDRNDYYVCEQGKYGIFDECGKMLIPPKWDKLSPLMDYSSIKIYPLSMYDADTGKMQLDRNSPADFVFGKLVDSSNWQKKYGVMDRTGKILLKPIYESIEYRINNLYKIKINGLYGFVDGDGKYLVPLQADDLSLTRHPAIFLRRHWMGTKDSFFSIKTETVGLMDAQGNTLLPAIYDRLEQQTIDNQCFWVYNMRQSLGLFHTTKGWLLDSTFQYRHLNDENQLINRSDSNGIQYYGVYNLKNTSWLLPIENKYEKIEYLKKDFKYRPDGADLKPDDAFKTQFFLQVFQKGKWGLYDLDAQKWILPIRYDAVKRFGDGFYAVSEAGKWYFVQEGGQKISTQLYDYMGEKEYAIHFEDAIPKDWGIKSQDRSYMQGCFAIQKDSVLFLNEVSFPNYISQKDFYSIYDNGNALVELEHGCFMDRQAHLIMSPMDTFLWSNGDGWHTETHRIVRQQGTAKQLLIDLEKGYVKPFLNEYKILTVNLEDNWVLVEDRSTKHLGMVTMDGKVILPSDFFGITQRDEQNVFFARRDFTCADSTQLQVNDTLLGALDHNWQLYDSTGNLLTTTFFDYPIAWSRHGIGIGRTQGKQGLWNAKGETLLSPKYDRIWYDEKSNIFYIFHNHGDSIMRFGFANGDGKWGMEPILKHLSPFEGDYALAETEKGVGLVDKKGQYLLEPAPDALEKAPFSIRDTAKIELFSEDNKEIAAHLDTISVKSHRWRVENKVLQETVSAHFLTSQNIGYQRNIKWHLCSPDTHIWVHGKLHEPQITLVNLLGSDKTLGFTEQRYSNERDLRVQTYHTFQWTNNHWQKVTLANFLTLNQRTETGLNLLMQAKIANLKYTSLDCGNPEMYWQQVKERFYLHPEGLLVFMSRSNEWFEADPLPILLTWAELKPFLKH